MCVGIKPHLCAHKCEGLDIRSKSVYVGVFCTLGLHGVEEPAQERLIERDLRDMAEVSMLRHAETGLWWAVKTSGRSRTTVHFVPAHTWVCIRAPCVITFAYTSYLYVCPVASRC